MENFFENVKKKFNDFSKSSVKFPFEVVYEEGIVTKKFVEDKKPLGVIFNKCLIVLEDVTQGGLPFYLNWRQTTEHCKNVRAGMDGGKKAFWDDLFQKNQFDRVNEVITALGGSPLKRKAWYWTGENLADEETAWAWCYDVSPETLSYSITPLKSESEYLLLRPVIDLKTYPLEYFPITDLVFNS